MKIDIIKDNFECTFSDMIDKSRYEVIATERKDTWIVRKREVVFSTGDTTFPLDKTTGTISTTK